MRARFNAGADPALGHGAGDRKSAFARQRRQIVMKRTIFAACGAFAIAGMTAAAQGTSSPSSPSTSGSQGSQTGRSMTVTGCLMPASATGSMGATGSGSAAGTTGSGTAGATGSGSTAGATGSGSTAGSGTSGTTGASGSASAGAGGQFVL